MRKMNRREFNKLVASAAGAAALAAALPGRAAAAAHPIRRAHYKDTRITIAGRIFQADIYIEGDHIHLVPKEIDWTKDIPNPDTISVEINESPSRL